MIKRMFPVVKDYTMLTLGAILIAASVNMFFVPNNVVTGGIMGVAMMLYSFFGTPIGIVTLLANIPLFIIGWRQLGGLIFGLRTLYATVIISLAIDLLAPYMPPVTKDPLLYILYGALLDGVGIGLVFRARGTTGGIDILARLIEQRFGVQPGRSLLVMNVAIFGAALYAYGAEPVLYAILAAFIGSFVLDYTLSAGAGARQALIITSQPEAITQALLHELGRGVTVLEAHGGYTGSKRSVLLSVVSRNEISFAKTIVSEADPHAFLIIGEASEVLGEGFRTFTSKVAKPAAAPAPVLAEEVATTTAHS